MSKGNHLVVHKRAEDGQIFHDEDCPKCTGNSPPPVVGDLGEKILICLEVMLVVYQDRVSGRITSEEFREKVLAFPDSILALIDIDKMAGEAGYAKLAKNQSLSAKPSHGIYSHDFNFSEGYETAQEEMIEAGWRKIE